MADKKYLEIKEKNKRVPETDNLGMMRISSYLDFDKMLGNSHFF